MRSAIRLGGARHHVLPPSALGGRCLPSSPASCGYQHSRWHQRQRRSGPPLLKTPAAAAPRASAAGAQGLLPEGCAVRQFIEAFNRRDLESMVALLAPDCLYHNLAYSAATQGQQEVRQVLQALLAATPPDWALLVDDATPPAPPGPRQPHALAITWRMASARGATPLPLLSGLSFFRVDPQGRICYIKESSEQLVKVPAPLAPLLAGAAPLLQLLPAPPPAAAAAGPPPQPEAGAGAGAGAGRPSAAGARVLRGGGGGGGGAAGGSRPGGALRAAAAAGGAQQGSPGSAGAGSGASQAERGQQGPAASGPQSSGGGGGGDSLGGLEGIWLKDFEASDMKSYDRALQLMQIGGLQRTTAMQLLEGVELEQTGAEVAVRFLTVVPFFKITERLPLGGTASMARRDLKPGSQQGGASVGSAGELQLDISWGAPNPGTLQEVYRVTPGGQLEVTATVAVAGGTEVTRQVYRRSQAWRPRYSWPPGGGALGRLWGRQ